MSAPDFDPGREERFLRLNCYEDWDMRITLRRRATIVLAVSCLASGWMSQVAQAVGKKKAPAPPVVKASDWLVSPELLDHARLKIVWQAMLPIRPGEGYDTIALLGDRLLIRSDRNYMWSLDAAKGTVAFSRSMALENIPVVGLIGYGDSLISVVGNRLAEYSTATGAEQRVLDPGLGIVGMPARNSQFFYLAAADRRLHAFRANDMVRVFQAAAENDSLITTVLADENMVIFGTSEGDVMAIAADAPRKLWEFKAPEAVAGSIVRDGDSLYFACKDTNVYRLDMTESSQPRMAWKFQTEAVLTGSPLVTDGYVYQYAPGRSLTAINKQTGQAAWSLAEGLDLLAEGGGKAYVITRVRTLAVMDNATGKRLYSVNCAAVTGHASNTKSARIYVMDEHGRVACLEPIQ